MISSKPYEYNFEIETILQQFIAIIDNAIVMRYSVNKKTNKRELDEIIKPGYILGTKQRVMLDIINKTKNYELPVVTISLGSISFTKERQAAKNQNIYVKSDSLNTVYARPTPISIKVDVTIIAKYMTDLYQIYAKLATQFQPALTYSWFVPQVIDGNWVELRNKIEWDGEIAFEVRTEAKESDEDKFTGKMSFTIQGWLFPTMNHCPRNDTFTDNDSMRESLIYNIGTTIVPSEETISRIHDEVSAFRPLAYSVLKGKEWEKYNNPRQFATAHPMITSVYNSQQINNSLAYYVLDAGRASKLTITQNSQLIINGYNLDDVKVLAIPVSNYDKIKGAERYEHEYSDFLHPFPNSLEEKPHKISGYLLNITKQTDNQLTINFKEPLEITGSFDLAVVNDVDYDLLSQRKGFTLKS